jgi:hypothetical protein
MRPYIAIIILSLTIAFGCNSPEKKTIDTFIEAQPSFYDLRNGDPTKNSWIRNPQNLLMVHETFKKIGYRNLIDMNLLNENPFIAQGVYINRPLRQIIDSLEITYRLDNIQEKYYREFWQRRKAEHNDSIVYVIVKEVKASFKNMVAPAFNNDLVNDTLYNLAFIEYRGDTLNSTIATDNFLRLKNFGFHQSAYNLLYETSEYENVKWNRDSLKSKLTRSDNFIFPWFQDDTK